MTTGVALPSADPTRGVLAAVLGYLAQDLVLAPIEPGTKGPRRKGWNTPAKWIDTETKARRFWSQNRAHGVGVIHGPSGTCVLDVDDVTRTREAFALLGLDLDSILAKGCRIVGNPERAKAIYAVDGAFASKLGHHQYAIGPDTIFELRGGKVQDILPPTTHIGTGNPYAFAGGGFVRQPVPPELLALFLDWPSTLRRLEGKAEPPLEPPAPSTPPAVRVETSVIGAYNAAATRSDILARNGYVQEQDGRRWLAPTSQSGTPGVVSLDGGKVYSHHGADPLADGHALDPFDLFRILEHGGDTRSAVKAAAEWLGLASRIARTTPAPALPAQVAPPSNAAPENGTQRTEQLSALIICAADLASHPELLVAPDAVIPGLAWKGRVTLFAGREKSGKSTLLAAGLAAYSRGLPFLGDPTPGGRVLCWSADREALADQLARLRRFDADLSQIDLVLRPPISFEEIASHVHGYGVFVVDTLASASTDVTDASASAQWVPTLLRYVDLARLTGVAVPLLHHATRATGKYRDSTSIGATVDAIVEMAPGSDPDTRELSTVTRWPTPAKRAVRLAGTVERAWYEVVGLLRPQLHARLLAAIEAEPRLSATEYAKRLGARKQDVLEGLNCLAADRAVQNAGTEHRPAWERLTVPAVPNGSGNHGSAQAGNGSLPLRGEPFRTAAAPDAPAREHGNRSETPPASCPNCGKTDWWTWLEGEWQCENCARVSRRATT